MTQSFLFNNKHKIKIFFTNVLFVFRYQIYITEDLLTGAAFLCTIKGVHYEFISIPNGNCKNNKYKGRFFMMRSFLFKYTQQKSLN